MVSYHLTVEAQDEHQVDSDSVETNTFWDNWYGQVGMDMNLIFPEGHNLKHVFPNGKSFGINASVGKWFSPDFGGRFKLTWNNGIFTNAVPLQRIFVSRFFVSITRNQRSSPENQCYGYNITLIH